MIAPTVGRIVWYQAGEDDFPGVDGGEQPLAAMVVHVWSDTCVNLVVYDANGVPASRPSTLLIQPESDRPGVGPFCEWMPYQKGQAAKTEELAAKEESGVAPD